MSAPKASPNDQIGGCAVVLLGLPVVIVLRGLVLATLWAWFVAPLGAPALGWAHASGLAGVVSFAVNAPRRGATADELKEGQTYTGRSCSWLFAEVFAMAFTVCCGSLLTRWM